MTMRTLNTTVITGIMPQTNDISSWLSNETMHVIQKTPSVTRGIVPLFSSRGCVVHEMQIHRSGLPFRWLARTYVLSSRGGDVFTWYVVDGVSVRPAVQPNSAPRVIDIADPFVRVRAIPLFANIVICICIASIDVVFRWTVRALRSCRGECRMCGYSCMGLPTDRCPECGSTGKYGEAPGT